MNKNEILFRLCLLRADAIINKVKSDYPGCAGALNCDDPKGANETTKDMLNAWRDYGPKAIQSLLPTIAPTAQAQFDANKQIAPQQNQLDYDLYSKYGPLMNQVGSQIANENALAASQGEYAIASGPTGQGLVRTADQLQRELDPEFYKSRALLGGAVDKYLNSYDPNQLTPTEVEQINRGISAREGPMTQSALSTVRNAQTFGNAATQRWQNFGNAVTQASSALPALRSGMSGFEIATRRPLVSNTGEARTAAAPLTDASSALNANYGFANNTINQIGANSRQAVAKTKDVYDKAQSASSSLSNVAGAVGGF